MRQLSNVAFVPVFAALAACGGGSDAAPPPVPALSITSPEFEVHGSGPVAIQVVAQGCAPATIELLVDGEALANLVPPFQYTWDTAWANEGHRVVTARASCGGAAATSAPVDIYVDRTPPTIVARTPAPGSKTAWVVDAIAVTFSEPVDLDSARSSIVLRKDAVAVPATMASSEGGARVTLLPAIPPVGGDTFSVEIGAGIRDLARLPLGAVTSWTFSYPLLVEPGRGPLSAQPGYYATAPNLSIDATGEPIVAWRPGSWMSEFTFAPDGKPSETIAWTPWGLDCGLAVRGSDAYLVDSSSVTLPDGTGGQQIRFLKPESGRFVPAGPMVTNGTSPGFDPEITFEPDGTPVAFWLEQQPGFAWPQLLRAAFLDGESWNDRGIPTLNQDGTQSATSPAVARDSQGRPMVAFSETFHVYVKAWNGVAWSLVGGGAVGGLTYAGAPAIAFDGDDPYVALTDYSTGRIRVYHVSGGLWTEIGGEPRRDTSLPANTPAIAVSGPGRLYLAWTEGTRRGDPSAAGSLYVSEWNGADWVPVAGPLNRGGDSAAYAPALAFDGLGPVVLWTEPQDLSSSPQTWNVRLVRANR